VRHARWYAARDLVREAALGALSRPARAALTAAGTALGTACLVAVLGLTTTAAAQVSARFDAIAATEVTISDTDPTASTAAVAGDVEGRLARLSGVVAGGELYVVRDTVRASRSTSSSVPAAQVPLHAAAPGALAAANVRPLAGGRLYDRALARRGERVAVLGSEAATALGIAGTAARAVVIDGIPFTVVGILGDTSRRPELAFALVVPPATARALWRDPAQPPSVFVRTRPGAAATVARQAPAALYVDDPHRLAAVTPPDPRSLRRQVAGDITLLLQVLAAICLVIGAVGIANTALVSVLERVAEIGLRRALGAQRRTVAAQFLLESAVLGAIGGLVGSCAGLVACVAIAFAQRWTVVVAPWLLVAGPFLGLATGAVAGLYPAWRATRVEPALALRR
jgi:putative ABC transport system permease protein